MRISTQYPSHKQQQTKLTDPSPSSPSSPPYESNQRSFFYRTNSSPTLSLGTNYSSRPIPASAPSAHRFIPTSPPATSSSSLNIGIARTHSSTIMSSAPTTTPTSPTKKSSKSTFIPSSSAPRPSSHSFIRNSVHLGSTRRPTSASSVPPTVTNSILGTSRLNPPRFSLDQHLHKLHPSPSDGSPAAVANASIMKTNEMMRAANERLLKANEAIIAANARLQKAREAKEKEEGSENEAEKVEEKPAVVAPASKPIKIVYHNDKSFSYNIS